MITKKYDYNVYALIKLIILYKRHYTSFTP